MNQIVLSGIRATGRLHFGSLLGAVKNFVELQDDPSKQCLYFVADYHTLTTLEDPQILRDHLIEMIKDYLAAGLDPNRSIIYAQSSVPAIAELSLFLSMSQPIGELLRVPTFKEKVRTDVDSVNLGLLSYPVLMAADILGPKANLVPVGSDQRPNVEMARNIAQRFNRRYGETFIVPEMLEEMIKIPGLDGGKMGKSESENTIGIHMSKDEVRERYQKRGITDPQRVRKTDPGDPYKGCQSVYPVHELISTSERENRMVAKQCLKAEIGCSECKDLLVERLFEILGPFQERRAEFADKDDLVREILHEGAKQARAMIEPTVEEVAEKMGIVRFLKN